MKHTLIQFRFFRKLFGGAYYLIRTNLPMSDYWSEKEIKSCGGITLKTEVYGKHKRTKA